MPKLSGLINERERAIGARVREIRLQTTWPQAAFANALGITRNQLAAVEAAGNPLRYALADRLCEQFGICQVWLANGEQPILGYVRVPPEIAAEIEPRELFSAAFDRRIGHVVKTAVRSIEAMKKAIASQVGGAEKLLEDRLYNLALSWFSRIPPHLYDAYFRELLAVSSAFFLQHSSEIQGLGSSHAPAGTLLTESSEVRNTTSDMKKAPTLKQLLAEVRRLTKPSGMKAKLANDLGVPPARVSEWLAGKYEPSGDTALRLFNWVFHPERQSK